MSKIYSSLKNLRDRTRASITIKSYNILFFTSLLLVLILAILIRLSPIVSGNYLIKAFDPWIQYYNAEYLSTHSVFEYFNWVDIKSWYPEGYARSNLRPGLTFTVVTIFQIINSIGIPVSLYDVCFYFPAFMGGASVLAIYLLGKEVLDRRCGLVAAFFLAFNPGFMQRTMAGFFDNETIGVFATLMTLYFFVKTLRTGKILDSFLGGLFLGYLALSWGGYNFVYLILPMVCGIIVLLKKYDSNVLIAYAGVEGVGLLVFSFHSTFSYVNFFDSLELVGIFLFTILLIIFHLIHVKKGDYPRLYNGLLDFLKWGLIPVVVVGAIIIWVAPDLIPFGFGKRLLSVISPLVREGLNIVASVAEHMPSSWGVFYYNTLIPLMLLPLGLFFLFKRGNSADYLLITFMILIFYFTGSMIRIILLFAPAACLVGAYGLVSVLKIFGSFYGEKRMGISRKRKRQVKRMVGKSEIGVVYFIVGIMCIAQVIHASNMSTVQLSQSQMTPGDLHDWEQTLTWMKTNLPGTAVVVSWWDYGYWLTPIGNMTTVNDNATINQTRIGMTGMALMQTNEIYSAKVFKDLHADYVLVYFGMLYPNLGGDEGKWPWMVRICNDNYQTYKNWGMEEDNWGSNSVFVEEEYFNSTSSKPTAKWFDSTLVKLMFSGLETDPPPDPNNIATFEEYYRGQINSRTDNEGLPYVVHIPEDGDYDFDVFRPLYFSANGMVKLFSIDYTALASSFQIENPEVFDTGYATFKIKNTGSKDLTISDVKINGESYEFDLGKGSSTHIINANEDDLVWVDIKTSGQSFQTDDVVKITVEAESVALDDKPYIFTNSTNNFFVEEAREGDIKINKPNSKVVQIDTTNSEIYLEVENTGDTTVILKDFYADNENNTFVDIDYISGSPILDPGQKAYVKITNSLVPFYPLKTEHKIGVITPNNIKDELLFTSNYEYFKISIVDESRIASPEALIATHSDYRKHIPINLDNTYAYTYDNGTTMVNIKIKNTGDIWLGIDSIHITKSSTWTEVLDFDITNINFGAGNESIINIIASDYLADLNVNDEIGIVVTTNFDGSTKASDVGFVHTIIDKPDIQIIDNVESQTTSYIAANETGKILIKNTGDESITLDKLYLNTTTMLSFDSDVNFEYGDISLDIQECALVSFNTTGLMLNASNIVNVNITTNTTAQVSMDFSASVDSQFYDVNIDDTGTSASALLNVMIKIENNGIFNVTVDSININGTYIPLVNFTESIYEIGAGSSIQFTISTSDLETIMGGISIDLNDVLIIIVRTKEGAEDIHEETVGS